MGSASQTFHTWLSTISRMWQKRADSSDFVWLARFRLLSLYTFFKSLLLLAAGVARPQVNAPLSHPDQKATPILRRRDAFRPGAYHPLPGFGVSFWPQKKPAP